VNCEVCGTELPHGAMFCGECGRAVGTRTTQTIHPDSGMPVDSSDELAASVPVESRDTAIIQPILQERLPELDTELPVEEPSDHELVDVEAVRAEAVRAEPVDAEPAEIEQDLPPDLVAEENAADEDAFDGGAPAVEPEPLPPLVTELPRRRSLISASSEILPPRPDPFPWGDRGSAIFSDSDELEQTLIVPRRDTGERFVLQFSTGESVTVFGSGLLGRNPTPQPTEYFDQLVSITDPGKSVSKTHLEFGQEAGAFWVSDRFSGNGSTVREPESSPRRLVAGKRYRIVRGTRVDIGEQFFVVS
jgi:hypothetical protein